MTERGERNLLNFFPFLHLLEEEDVLVPADEETFPDEVLDDWESENLEDCLQRANWENCSFFTGFFCPLSNVTAFQIT